MAKPLAIVLVSGGMDSCVTAAIAAQDCCVAFMHASYGQRTQQRELRAFHDLADSFGAMNRLTVTLDHLSSIGGSSLTDPAIPVAEADLGSKVIPTSYVPFRNANMLSAAVSWAELLQSSAIYVGAVEEDSSGYPDCREEFFRAFEEVIRTGTKASSQLRILTPVIKMSKAEIVLRGVELGAPFHLTWSCYREEDRACGTCDSCARRLRGFQIAGIEDPIPYVRKPFYADADIRGHIVHS
jgi:7-cyano-7-deazaguanine synthase